MESDAYVTAEELLAIMWKNGYSDQERNALQYTFPMDYKFHYPELAVFFDLSEEDCYKFCLRTRMEKSHIGELDVEKVRKDDPGIAWIASTKMQHTLTGLQTDSSNLIHELSEEKGFDADENLEELGEISELDESAQDQLEKRVKALEHQKAKLMQQVAEASKVNRAEKMSLKRRSERTRDAMMTRLEHVMAVDPEIAWIAHGKVQKTLKHLQAETANLIHELIEVENAKIIKIC